MVWFDCSEDKVMYFSKSKYKNSTIKPAIAAVLFPYSRDISLLRTVAVYRAANRLYYSL